MSDTPRVDAACNSAHGVIQTTDNLFYECCKMEREIAQLKIQIEHREVFKGTGNDDVLDMMRDEFMRISAICANHPDDTRWQEVAGLCRRAKNTIEQKVPVVVQRDKLEAENARLRTVIEIAKDALK